MSSASSATAISSTRARAVTETATGPKRAAWQCDQPNAMGPGAAAASHRSGEARAVACWRRTRVSTGGQDVRIAVFQGPAGELDVAGNLAVLRAQAQAAALQKA